MSAIVGSGDFRYRIADDWAKRHRKSNPDAAKYRRAASPTVGFETISARRAPASLAWA
ncbi:MAG TPA: hypothetical protein VGA51_14875 [Casimicrobiaceae bacterium]